MTRRAPGETREAIIQATIDLLRSERSVDRVSVEAVVARVGCTPPTLYYYFDTKDELVAEACRREYESFGADLQSSMKRTGDITEDLGARGSAYLRWALDHPTQYEFLFMTRSDRVPDPAMLPTDSTLDLHDVPGLGDLVRDLDLVRAEGYRIENTSVAAFELWGIVHGFAALGVTNPEIPFELLESSMLHACGAAIATWA